MAEMTLTKAMLTEKLGAALGISKAETQAFIETFFEEISAQLARGDSVKLSGFGNFVLLDKAKRLGRNPKTGKEVMIEARKVVTFRPGNKLKNRVASRGKDEQRESEQES